jgi:hypothetical protein
MGIMTVKFPSIFIDGFIFFIGEYMEFIKKPEDACHLLEEISKRSKMKGVSPEYTALDKAEEELIECLMEVRKLKSHYNEIKVNRKELTSDTRNKVILNLIDEIGDIYVDVFIGIPSTIPGIEYAAINKRITDKIKKYQKVINKLDIKYNIKRGYENNQIASAI